MGLFSSPNWIKIKRCWFLWWWAGHEEIWPCCYKTKDTIIIFFPWLHIWSTFKYYCWYCIKIRVGVKFFLQRTDHNILYVYSFSFLSSLFSFFLKIRLTEVGGSLFWNSETENHMRTIKQRSMMILPWNTWPMCYFSWRFVLLRIRSSMISTGTGTPGSCHLSPAVSTCLVRTAINLCRYFLLVGVYF